MEKEILKRDFPYTNNSPVATINAIVKYLDEEWEKNKPCEHEDTEQLLYGTKRCKKCYFVGNF